MLLNFAIMKNKKETIIRYWLITGLSIIILMIIIGGITRLTNSGLSMVDWSVFGELSTKENIENAYYKWQESPQGNQMKLTLKEFKSIYFWEYIHRMTGRFLGFLFIIPFLFFIIKRWIKKQDLYKYYILLILGGLQGFLGWFMVKSGLTDIPRVSHFRLAIHLIAALCLSSYILWIILSNKSKRQYDEKINKAGKIFLSLIIIQIIYGAFTAGMKAGHIQDPSSVINTIFGYFNTKNFENLDILNNPFNVQLFHRYFAWIILIYCIYLWKITKKTPFKKAGIIIMSTTTSQIILGVLTLITKINIQLAVAHQLTAVIILFSTIYLIYKSSDPNPSIETKK